MVFLIGLILIAYGANSNAETVREWWVNCGANSATSTCLNESELAKFKTICSNKDYREDCRKVVDYVVARTRVSEAKSFLLSGYAVQIASFTENNKYLNDIEKIWSQEKVDKAFSFAMGVLPNCNIAGDRKLVFSKKLRPEVKEFQNEMIKIYESLSALPCPDSKNGFVLVTIGKVQDSNNEFEVFTVDEKRNLKVIRTTLSAGPFASKYSKLGN